MRPLALGLLAVSLSLAASGCRSAGPRPLPPVARCDCESLFTPQQSCAGPGTAEAGVPGAVALDRPVEHLVFEGGGVKGVAYVGALQVLGEHGVLDGVTSVAGTSAGSITALAVALGYTPEEITTLILNLDFEKFRDGTFLTDAFRLYERYGWYEGRYAECVFECLVEGKLGDADATFADLHERSATDPALKDLYVVSTDLDRREWVVFSHESGRFADLPLARGARASMSIPFFFASQEVDGATFVDGGVLRNYPIDVFDESRDADPGASTLGFFLGSLGGGTAVTDLLVFTEEVFATLLAEQTDELCLDPGQLPNVRRTVFIDPLGIATTDFSITGEQKCELVRSGREATELYLTQGPSESCPARLTGPADGPGRR